MNVAQGLLPVFFALAVGYAAGRFDIVPNRHIEALNSLVMRIALPLALFTILAGSDRADVVAHLTVGFAVFVVMALTYAGVYVLQRRVYRLPPGASAIQALTVGFPNTAAVGLPIAGTVLGATGSLAVAVSLAVGSITLSPLTIGIVNRDRGADRGGAGAAAADRPSPARAFGRAVRTPVVLAPIAGLAWSVIGLPFPDLLRVTFDEIGGLTAGLALFVTGLVLSAQSLRITGNVAVSTMIAVLVRPALALGVVAGLRLGAPMAAEVVLLMAVPPGFFGILLGASAHRPTPVAGPTLCYSTLISAGTLPLVILALPQL